MKSLKTGSFKFIIASVIGLTLFFYPINTQSGKTILIDSIISTLLLLCGDYVKWIILAASAWGVFCGFRDKQYSKGLINSFFFFAKCAGAVLGIIYLMGLGPSVLYKEKILPFLFDNICRSIILLLPIGGMALVFLTEYGLMEFIGFFFERFMRKMWKVPGLSTIDMLTSFVGSFSLGFILTDKMYSTGKYSDKEAVIIATGFSTVSTSFMITLCRALDIMDIWAIFFLTAFIANLLVTFFVIRLWPINCYNDKKKQDLSKSCCNKTAFEQASERANSADPLISSLWHGFVSGINMLGIMIPTILSIGTVGMLLVIYTPIFKLIGLCFFPFVWIFIGKNAMIVSKALATTIIDTFLPVPFIGSLSIQCRFLCGIVIVCEILFFTASIPALLATSIPIRTKDLLIIWFERMIFSIIIAGASSFLIFLFI